MRADHAARPRQWRLILTRSDDSFDLQPAIDSLRSLRSDLEAYYWEQPPDPTAQGSRRYQVSHWIRQLSDRTAALESIVLHMGTSCLRLPDLAGGEREALRAAAAVLDRWVPEDEVFDRVLEVVAAALAAADRIGLRAAGGTPEKEASLVGPRIAVRP